MHDTVTLQIVEFFLLARFIFCPGLIRRVLILEADSGCLLSDSFELKEQG